MLPKVIKKLDGWLGLNTETDEEEILDVEVVASNGVMFDQGGQMRTAGDLVTVGTGQGQISDAFLTVEGYGALSFGSDHNLLGAENEDFIIAYQHNSGADIKLKDKASNFKTIAVGAAMVPFMSFERHALRILDRTFANDPQWFGFIDRDYYKGPHLFNESDWFQENVALQKPVLKAGWNISIPIANVTQIAPVSPPISGYASEVLVYSATQPLPGTVVLLYDSSGSNLYDGFYTATLSFGGDPANTFRIASPDNGTQAALTTVQWRAVDADYIAAISGSVVPTAANEVGIYLGGDASAAGNWTHVWELSVSFQYDDNQEGPLSDPVVVDLTVALSPDNIRIDCLTYYGSTPGAGTVNERVTGVKLYMRKSNTEDWFLEGEYSFVNGSKAPNSGTGLNWAAKKSAPGLYSSPTSYYAAFAPDGAVVYRTAPNGIITYLAETGVSGDDFIEKYKASTIAVNRLFAIAPQGNLDRVIVSPAGKFDMLSEGSFLEILSEDGDELVTAATIADRVLLFKKRKMVVLDVSSGSPETFRIENTYDMAGVETDSAVFELPASVVGGVGAVVIANENGLHYFDGQFRTISDLQSINNVKRGINKEWQVAFDGENICVGYEVKTKTVIILDAGFDSDNDFAYLFDTQRALWSKQEITTTAGAGTRLSAFYYSSAKELSIIDFPISSAGIGKKYNHEQQSQAVLIKTKNYDEGLNTNKYVYKVVVDVKSFKSGPFEVLLIHDGGNVDLGDITAAGLATFDFTATKIKTKFWQLQISGGGQITVGYIKVTTRNLPAAR